FGAMDAPMQSALLGAARRFKQGGRAAVTGEELGLLQGNPLTGELVRERLERDVRNDPLTGDLLKLTGQRKIEDIEAQLKRVKTEVDVKVQVDEEQFFKLFTEKLRDANIGQLIGEWLIKKIEMDL